MSDARLYDDLIMDHIRNARNYRALRDADRKATGVNPLCGDEVTVYVGLEGERIVDLGFQCTCCGISMASASIMTEIVGGRRVDEARALLRDFVDMLNHPGEPVSHAVSAERLAILQTVGKFPARSRCAALPWATLQAALEQQEAVFLR